MLVGSDSIIAEARRYNRMFRGALRQAGVLAAACLYALDHHVERLADDHLRARRLAADLGSISGLMTEPGNVEANIVLVGTREPRAFAAALAAQGVLASVADARTVRFVTHLDVGDHGIEAAVRAAQRASQLVASG